jgi:hypothetical protein
VGGFFVFFKMNRILKRAITILFRRWYWATGHPTWVTVAENGVFSEEYANLSNPSGTF